MTGRKRPPAQEPFIPLRTLRLIAGRDPDDPLGVIPSFRMRLLVESLERQARLAKEAERKPLPASFTSEDYDRERYRQMVRTSTLEGVAREARRQYEDALRSYGPPDRGE